MAKKLVTARVLVAISICGIALKPNDLIKAEEALLKGALENKELSTNKADIEYCENELKAEAIDISKVDNSQASDDAEVDAEKDK